jgi:hypothetical protein
MVEYNEAVQHPAQAFTDAELKQGSIRQNNLGLPVPMSGGFALTYTLTTPRKTYAIRCFHREIPAIEQRYNEISKKLKSLNSEYFVSFDFQKGGIKIRQNSFPIVKMDWVKGDPLGVWLDQNFGNATALQKLRKEFSALALFLNREGIAHGDVQNGNVMISNGTSVRLIDYDGMFVPGLRKGDGTETGHKHFQHPDRAGSDFGPSMDRFSFITVDLSLQALIEDKTLHQKFRDGGETIIFKANDFADPQSSEIFRILMAKPRLRDQAQRFASICDADIDSVPMLEDFLAGKNIPAARSISLAPSTTRAPAPKIIGYISAFPVVDALNCAAAARHVGDRVELIGKIVEVKPGVGRRGRGRDRPYIFINFGNWREDIVKISIWSEGLEKLTETPSSSWVGRWVSVTGLIDPPFTSHRFHYTHLSITVEQDGQIQRLDEQQARFRLDSIGKATPQRARAPVVSAESNRTIVQEVIQRTLGSNSSQGGSSTPATRPGTPATPIVVPRATVPSGSLSQNQRIVELIRSAQGGHSSAAGVGSAASSPPSTQVPTSSASTRVPTWVWSVGGIILLILIVSLAQKTAPSSTVLPAQPRIPTLTQPTVPAQNTSSWPEPAPASQDAPAQASSPPSLRPPTQTAAPSPPPAERPPATEPAPTPSAQLPAPTPPTPAPPVPIPRPKPTQAAPSTSQPVQPRKQPAQPNNLAPFRGPMLPQTTTPPFPSWRYGPRPQ